MMAEKTITTYICDGCGKRSHTPDFNDGSTCGSMKLKYKFHKGGRGFDGAWGGTTFQQEMLLCPDCGDSIANALRALAGEAGQ